MDNFVYFSAVLLWGINLAVLFWLNIRIKEQNKILKKEAVELLAKAGLSEAARLQLTEIAKLVKAGNKDQQEIKTRLTWARRRELRDLRYEGAITKHRR
jgi:hypothetical protein